jgi:hypothetical protein
MKIIIKIRLKLLFLFFNYFINDLLIMPPIINSANPTEIVPRPPKLGFRNE